MALVLLKLRFFLRSAKRFLRKNGTSSFDPVRIYLDKELVIVKGFVNSIFNLQLS